MTAIRWMIRVGFFCTMVAAGWLFFLDTAPSTPETLMSDYPATPGEASFDVGSLLAEPRESSGIFFNWRGVKTQDFTMSIKATVESDRTLVFTRFLFADGASWDCPWVVAMVAGDHEFTLSSSLIEGEWTGHEGGKALRIRSPFPILWRGWTFRVMADHWAFRVDDRRIFHDIRLSKWGISLGRVSMVTPL